jgi:uncharacterized protein YyaL (SSP411 family)
MDRPDCADASYLSYRRSDLQPDVADQWYVASQILADAELLHSDQDDDARCHLAKALQFLGRLRENGGYAARAAPDGSAIAPGPFYADDNALAGLSLLAAADVETNPPARQADLDAARSVADFLTTSGLWDETFGGGFWWNTNRGDRPEGKPAQSNALAALFFARLHVATGDENARVWSLRTLDWLDATLYDPDTRLYRWSARYQDPQHHAGGPVLANRYFNYDQAIAIQAQIAAARLDARPDRLERAREVGQAVQAAFWNAARGGYNIEVGVDRVFASYGAWTSFGHLALYDQDHDPAWLALAQRNADALDAMFRRDDGGYGFRQFRCLTPFERTRPGCEGGDSAWVVDRTRDGAAQAWIQFLQAALARRLGRQ